ncbi:hypothetical protein R3P38DRAFT_3093539 [Favolaschia claudopus]|uniref:Uncharacterized protein n=1 Tax=Favolaschia claudopus TaxID=2862362 RepID=A0AAV9ZQR5_9AGAR
MPLPTMNQDSSKSSLDLTQLNTEELLALANRSVHRAIEVAQEPAVSALSVEEALHKDLESRIDELKKANERLQMRCDAESVIRESGIDELRRLRAESERHAAVVASKDAMVNELKGKVSELEAKAGDAEFSLNNACTRVDDLFIQRDMILESHAAEIAEKERAVAEKDAFIVDLRATNSNLQAEIAERARKRTALLASLQSLEEGMHEGAQTQIEGSASSPGALKRKLPFPTPSSESPDIGSSPELKEELSPATRSTSRAKPNSEGLYLSSDAKISLNPRSMIENKSSEGNQSPERCDPSRDDEDDLTSLSPSSESESEEADRAPSGESDSDSNSDSESDTPLRKLRSRKTAAKSNTQQRIMTRSSDKVEPAKKRRRVGSDF